MAVNVELRAEYVSRVGMGLLLYFGFHRYTTWAAKEDVVGRKEQGPRYMSRRSAACD